MRRLTALLTVLVAVVTFAACGGGGSDKPAYEEPKGPAVATVELQSGSIYFKPTKLTTKPGIVEIVVDNKGGAHDLKIHEIPGFKIDLSSSGVHKGKVKLEAGKTYKFYCSIPGHEAAGMKGTITVE